MSKGEFLSAKTNFSTTAKLSALVFQFVHENESKSADPNISKKTFDGQKVVKLSTKPALVFPHLAHNGHVLMQAWAFEATSCPTRPNEVKKTKL